MAAATSVDILQQRHRALATPREHGAWGMLLVPLATGAALGLARGGKLLPALWLAATALALFWLRTPLESLLGTSLVKARTQEERRWLLQPLLVTGGGALLASILLLTSVPLWPLLQMAGLATVLLAGQFWLAKQGRSTRMAAQMVGALALCLTAPAAWYASTAQLGSIALTLWLLNCLFAVNQIHYVQVRIRSLKLATVSERLQQARGLMLGEVLLLVVLLAGGWAAWWPLLAAIAFVPVLLRGIGWLVAKAAPPTVRRLGLQELSHAIVFGVLMVMALA